MPTIVRRLSATTPLAVASSSNRALIETALRTAGIDTCFATTVSSEEVPRGKPSPDVYLEAARRLRVAPSRCVAVEDSASGIRAAHSAGMRVLGYPNLHYPPAAETLRLASAIIASPEDILRALADG